MTRRGSLVYYLVAVVCGCFFLAAAYHGFSVATGMAGPRWGRDFLFIYFLALILGFLPAILSAWLLRRVAGWFGWHRAWQWSVVGTLLMMGVLLGIGHFGLFIERTHFPQEYQNVKSGVMAALLAPMLFTFRPLWLAALAVAPTAWILFLVHRAFESSIE